MSKIIKQIDLLKSMDISPIEVAVCLDDIFSNMLIQNYHLHKGFFVIRVRPDFEYKDNIDIKELSYKPKFLNKKYQRASIPDDTMFYCCSCERKGFVDGNPIFPFTDIEDGLYISLFETISELRDSDVYGHGIDPESRAYKYFKSYKNFTKKITYSIWMADSILTVALLSLFKSNDINIRFGFFPYFYYGNILLKSNREPSDIRNFTNFYEYLTNEFVKYPVTDDRQYLISAWATKILCMKGYDGVAYQSVRCAGDGINFAITPSVIDKNLLRCVEIGNFQLTCKDNNLLLEDIKTQFKDFPSNKPSLLDKSIQLNKSGKKEMINL